MRTVHLFDGVKVPCRTGESTLSAIGSGPPVLIIDGIPGVPSAYIRPWLTPMAEYRTLIFYDQHESEVNASREHLRPADRLVQQLVDILLFISAGRSVGIFAHSFGTFLLFAALRKIGRSKVREAILCSPFALDNGALKHLREKLRRSLSDRICAHASELDGMATSAEVSVSTGAQHPYLVAFLERVLARQNGKVRVDQHADMLETLGEFDSLAGLTQLPHRTLWLLGSEDCLASAPSIASRWSRAEICQIPGAGHFPFIEQPSAFTQLVQRFLSAHAAYS